MTMMKLLKQKKQKEKLISELKNGEIPYRVTHNDTKLSNVLFDRKTNLPRCMIDLDTVMKGSVLYDLADAIRSGANTSTEEERKLLNIRIDLELVKEFLRGFSEGAPSMLTKNEIDYFFETGTYLAERA